MLGAGVFVGLLLVWVVLPLSLLNLVESHGGVSALSVPLLMTVGVGLAGLGALRYVLRPTPAFGPVAALSSVILIVYLFTLAAAAHLTFAVSGQTSVTIDYGTILELLAIVPLFGLAAALVTTAEDLFRPGERVRVDYPPR